MFVSVFMFNNTCIDEIIDWWPRLSQKLKEYDEILVTINVALCPVNKSAEDPSTVSYLFIFIPTSLHSI